MTCVNLRKGRQMIDHERRVENIRKLLANGTKVPGREYDAMSDLIAAYDAAKTRLAAAEELVDRLTTSCGRRWRRSGRTARSASCGLTAPSNSVGREREKTRWASPT